VCVVANPDIAPFSGYVRVGGDSTGTRNSVGLSVVMSELSGDLVPAGNPVYVGVSEDLSIRVSVQRLGWVLWSENRPSKADKSGAIFRPS
jgi:hypothetical protein